MKKFLVLSLTCLTLLSISVPTFASTKEGDSSAIEDTIVNEKDYQKIVEEKATLLTYDDLTDINKIVKNDTSITDQDVLKLLVEKIEEKSSEEKGSKVSLKASSSSYEVFGRTITSAEAKLVAKHPIAATEVAANASTAEKAAKKKYKSSELYLGNGDAFRHAYWNALNVNFIEEDLAEDFADAHESETPSGVDKTMDLKNNKIGRSIGLSTSIDKVESKVEKYCDSGKLWRVVKNKLVETDSSGKK